jgi:hypothetical protein
MVDFKNEFKNLSKNNQLFQSKQVNQPPLVGNVMLYR